SRTFCQSTILNQFKVPGFKDEKIFGIRKAETEPFLVAGIYAHNIIYCSKGQVAFHEKRESFGSP
ncbi:MAG: hypothetical protein V2I31_04880, partial [Mariniphaga sp.]|nr:hypothetical protein [Mariniphaga sp.]